LDFFVEKFDIFFQKKLITKIHKTPSKIGKLLEKIKNFRHFRSLSGWPPQRNTKILQPVRQMHLPSAAVFR